VPTSFVVKKGVEDPLLELSRDPRAGVRERDSDPFFVAARGDPDCLVLRVCERVACIREQVDEDLLELDRVGDHEQLVGAKLELDLDSTQAKLLLDEEERALDHIVDVDLLDVHPGGPAEGAQVGDDLRRLPHLLHRLLQIVDQ